MLVSTVARLLDGQATCPVGPAILDDMTIRKQPGRNRRQTEYDAKVDMEVSIYGGKERCGV